MKFIRLLIIFTVLLILLVPSCLFSQVITHNNFLSLQSTNDQIIKTIPENDKVSFFKYREVTLSDQWPTIWKEWRTTITQDIYKKYQIENWDIEKLRKYVDMLKAFGFNSIQLHDLWENYIAAGWGTDPDLSNWPDLKSAEPRDWPRKVEAIADYALSIGLRTSLFIWGNAGFDYRDNKAYRNLNPNESVARDILEQYWYYQAEHAPHFDHIVTHWADPGGCIGEGCSIKLAMQCHNEIVQRFQRKNPRIQSSFSLWQINSTSWGRWTGYKDVHTILDAGVLMPDVMIATQGDGGRYNLDEVQAIRQAKRKAGNWCWYLADNEILPGFRILTSKLDSTFKKYPNEAHTLLEWQTVESNTHILNIPNLYVAAKLMQNPRINGRDALAEFITGAFGQENLESILHIFDFVEKIKGISWYKENPWTELTTARESLTLIQGISIPDGFYPIFPMIVTPQELLKEIEMQIRVLIQYMEFSKEALKVNEMQKNGEPKDKILDAIANLPKVDPPTKWMTNYEYTKYLRDIKKLEGK